MARVRMAERMDANPMYERKEILFNVLMEARRRAATAMATIKTAVQVPCTVEGDKDGQILVHLRRPFELNVPEVQKARASQADLREMALRATESPTNAEPTVASSKTR